MSATDNPPSLALSDIMHAMSPSPVPGPGSDDGDTVYGGAASTSIEGYTQVDVANLRRRLNDLGYPVARQPNAGGDALPPGMSSREKELLDMVLSLMTSVPVDPAQLERQAETISSLTAQRDFLARQAVEDRERWQSERESWERSAEALLLVKNRPSKPEDAERMRMSYEAENKALREKLHETQRRQAALEAELLKLKPMLLMQPSPISRQDKGKGKEMQSKYQVEFVEQGLNQTQHNALKKQLAARAAASGQATASTSQVPDAFTTLLPAAGSSTNANADSNQQQRSRDPKSQPKKTGPPLMSDAYSEHLLLAAKRLGRKRVAFITGYNLQAEKEALAQEQEQARAHQEQDRAEQERIANGAMGPYYRTVAEASTSASASGTVAGVPAASPLRVPHIIPVIGNSPLRTPKRGGIHFSNFASAQNNLAAPVPETPLVYVNANPVTRSPWAGSGVMGTPRQIKATMGRQNGRATTTATPATDKATASNPPTPLASLLDAALMIDGEGSTASKLRGSKTNGKGRTIEEPESPVPPQKRRRVSAAGGAGSGKGNVGQGKGLERVRTALDVLADQADQASAAFIDTDQSERRGASLVATSNNAGNKGKGKARERHPAEDRAEERNGEMEGGLGRGRATRRESARSIIPPSQMSVISTRPVRQASRRRAASPPVQQPTASSSTSSARGTSRTRGRPKNTANTTTPTNSSRPQRGRADNEAASVRIISPPGSRIISPPGPRVIAPGPGYSPLDEAIALTSSRAAGKAPERERERERRSEEHEHERDYTPRHPPQSQQQTKQNEPKIGGLRPVVAWGQRARPSSFDSDSSPVRGSERRRPVSPPHEAHDRDDHDNDNNDVDEFADDKTNDDDDDNGTNESGGPSEPSPPIDATVIAISAEEPITEPLHEPEPMSAEPAITPASERMSVEPTLTPAPEPTPAESEPAPEPDFVEPTSVPMPVPVEPTPIPESTPTEPTPAPEQISTKSALFVESVSVEIASTREPPSRDTGIETPMEVDDAPPDLETSANGHIPREKLSTPPPSSPSASTAVQPSPRTHADDVHMKDPEPAVDEDADADADVDADDDQDAEGEQEDDEENDEDISSMKPPRSRSPPPPDPPPPGPSGGSPPGPGQDDEHDPDADAEGEVEFEDNEDHSGGIGNSLSTSHRGATTYSRSGVHCAQRPTIPCPSNAIPKSTCTASEEHTASGLSDILNTVALGLIISVLTNIPAKLEPKRGWRAHESRLRVFPAKRANKISFKWRNSDGARLGQISFPGNYARLTNPSLSDSSSSNTGTLLRPPTINIRLSCGAPPVIIPSLEVVS